MAPLRSATDADLPRVAALLRATQPIDVERAGPEDEAFAAFVAGIDRDGGRTFLLCEDEDGVLTGALLSSRHPVADRPCPVRSFRVAVDPSARGRGVGRLLLDAVASLDPPGEVALRTVLDDGEASRLSAALARRGFERVQTTRVMRRSGVPPAALSPAADLCLRDARLPAEASTLAALHNAAHAGAFGFAPLDPDELVQMASAPGGRTVVLERAGELLGAFQTLPFHGGVGVLHAVQVRPAEQGRGLGRLLTVAALHALAQQGFHTVELAVDAANGPAVRLYEDLGFVDDRRELTYERPPA